MVRSILPAFGFVRRRLWRIVSVAVILAAAALGGVNLWAWHHFRAAEKALRDENLDEAQDHICRCLRVWRLGPQTHLLAARIDGTAGRYAEAERHLRECRRLQHGVREETQFEEILLRAQSGDIREVEQGLWNCVHTGDPRSRRILETLARVYMLETRLGAALEALTRWLELEPEAARAWHWRGKVYEGLMQTDKAIPDHEKAVELEPGRWGARLRLVRLLLNKHKVEAARLHLQELMRGHGDDLNVQVAQAQAYMLEGKEEESISLLDRLLEEHPHHFETLYLRSRLASQQEPSRPAEEEKFLRRALSERPADYRSLHALYLCLKQQGKEKEAAEVRAKQKRIEKDINRLNDLITNQVERAPYDPNVFSEVGELLIKLGDEEAGLQWLYRTLRDNPNHTHSRRILIDYYESKGLVAEAKKLREAAVPVNGRSPSLSTIENGR